MTSIKEFHNQHKNSDFQAQFATQRRYKKREWQSRMTRLFLMKTPTGVVMKTACWLFSTISKGSKPCAYKSHKTDIFPDSRKTLPLSSLCWLSSSKFDSRNIFYRHLQVMIIITCLKFFFSNVQFLTNLSLTV